ncbi:transporter substrate-binding domain-containing protein [Bradyrhizobium sp. LHD-71]|uniref:transporter substrate-binding domain-containing protein n=1 Tax=Bradyrhizobium sp. LHD-71 TaxID=3072141 RepID=UPI00280F13AA|nr:transporter substrate-binding domain-containing protein [Bradyrhizobium sp. LHD-71]MDQ8727986.1 transporter substrate-binding domain-containing protein [Bradyrhizobium sp. LHD-71]
MDACASRQTTSLLLLLVAVCLLAGDRASAQPAPSAPQAVKVGVYVNPPFVTREGSGYTGMAVELWQKVATDLSLASTYQEFRNDADLVEAVAKGTVQAAVTNLSITTDRARQVDFTQPWFDAGLRVMVHSDARTGVVDIVRDLRDAGHLANFGWILLGIVVVTTLLTIFDRWFDTDFHRRWRDGLADNFYHVTSLATKGEAERKNILGWIGRIGQGIWLLCSVAVIAYVASSITSVMTAAHIANRINSVTDLHGKTVAVRRGSAAEDQMKTFRVKMQPFDHIAEAADALLHRRVDAIVGDNPVLEYFAHTHPNLPLEVVGNTFHPEKYGFAFTPGSALTKPVSLRIIGLQESGEVEKLRNSYFGFKP